MKPKDSDASPPPTVSRRALIASAGVAAGTAALATLIPELGAQQAPTPSVPDDPSAIPGRGSEALNSRSAFEVCVMARE